MAYDTSPLSHENILRDIHDPATQTIRTSATAIIAPGLAVDIDHTGDSIAIGTSTDLFTSTSASGKIGLDVNVINALPLSVNAATESTLSSILTELQAKTEPSDAQNIRALSTATDSILVPGVAQETTLSSIDTKIVTTINGIKVDGSAVTQPVSQVGTWNILLPSDAATATLQTIGNTSLNNIDNKLPVLGQHTSSNSISVVLASDQTLTVLADLNAFSSSPDNVQLVGSIDGTTTGTKYGFVNNVKMQILDSHDRQSTFTYADFGTKDQRVIQIDYTSPTFTGFTARRIFNYTLVGTRYKRTNELWNII